MTVVGVLVWAGQRLWFWYDEWSIILDRPDPSATSLLAPHVDHLSLIPVGIYQALLRLVGLHTYWPYIAVGWACHIACAWLLYAVIAHRTDRRLGLVAAISLLTLGSAFENVLNAWQMSFLISCLGGLLAIAVLDRSQSPVSLFLASSGLLVAVAASSVGVLFLGAVGLWAILEHSWNRVAATVAPVVLYGAWYLTWGRASQGPIGLEQANVREIVASLGTGIGAASAGIVGLPPYAYATVGLAIAGAIAIRGLLAGFRPSSLGIAVGVALLAEYGLQAVFRAGFGVEHATRSAYIYPAAIFIWIVVGDAARSWRAPALMTLRGGLAFAALTIAIIGNAVQFRGATLASWGQRVDEVAILNLIVSLRQEPTLALDTSPDEELLPQVTPRRFLSAFDRFGPLGFDVNGGPRPPNLARVDAARARLLGAATPPVSAP